MTTCGALTEAFSPLQQLRSWKLKKKRCHECDGDCETASRRDERRQQYDERLLLLGCWLLAEILTSNIATRHTPAAAGAEYNSTTPVPSTHLQLVVCCLTRSSSTVHLLSQHRAALPSHACSRPRGRKSEFTKAALFAPVLSHPSCSHEHDQQHLASSQSHPLPPDPPSLSSPPTSLVAPSTPPLTPPPPFTLLPTLTPPATTPPPPATWTRRWPST